MDIRWTIWRRPTESSLSRSVPLLEIPAMAGSAGFRNSSKRWTTKGRAEPNLHSLAQCPYFKFQQQQIPPAFVIPRGRWTTQGRAKPNLHSPGAIQQAPAFERASECSVPGSERAGPSGRASACSGPGPEETGVHGDHPSESSVSGSESTRRSTPLSLAF